MRFLVDSNVLVAATMKEVSGHRSALDLTGRILSGDTPWCLSWINVYEFLRVVTHRRVFPNPLDFAEAFEQVETLLAHPACEMLQETSRHARVLSELAMSARPVAGNFVHDCHIAALLMEHDVRGIVTFDSHFRRFGSSLEVLSPEEALQGFFAKESGSTEGG